MRRRLGAGGVYPVVPRAAQIWTRAEVGNIVPPGQLRGNTRARGEENVPPSDLDTSNYRRRRDVVVGSRRGPALAGLDGRLMRNPASPHPVVIASAVRARGPNPDFSIFGWRDPDGSTSYGDEYEDIDEDGHKRRRRFETRAKHVAARPRAEAPARRFTI